MEATLHLGMARAGPWHSQRQLRHKSPSCDMLWFGFHWFPVPTPPQSLGAAILCVHKELENWSYVSFQVSDVFFFLPPCTLISWTFAKIKCRELLWQNTEPFEVRSSSVMRAASGHHFQKWWLYDCAVFAMVSASLGHMMFSGHTMMLLQS